MSWALLRRYWKLAAGAALLAALLWALHSYGQRRYEAGKDYVQAQWDADEQTEKAEADRQIAQNQADEAAARVRNEEIERDYQKQVADAAADRERTYRLLQQARAAANRSAAKEATDSLVAATAGEAGIVERIDRAVAGVRAEGEGNADQLDALIAVVKPQM